MCRFADNKINDSSKPTTARRNVDDLLKCVLSNKKSKVANVIMRFFLLVLLKYLKCKVHCGMAQGNRPE